MKLSNAKVSATLPVTNLDKVRSFYEQTLGFQPSRTPDAQGITYCAGGHTEFTVYTRPTPTKADQTAMSITVDDLDATLRDLRAKGVQPQDYNLPNVKTTNGIAEMGDTRGAWIEDPACNVIALVELKGEARSKFESMTDTTTTGRTSTTTTGTTSTTKTW